MFRTICFSVIAILLLSFIGYMQLSPKKILNNYKFTSLQQPDGTNNYWIIRDSIHQEYANGKLFAISKVDWLPDNSYKTTFRWLTIDVKEEILAAGDTMRMEVLSFNNDTLTLLLSTKRVNGVVRYLRSAADN